MEHLFFDSDKGIGDVANMVFNVLGLQPELCESKNVLNDSYYEVAIFGMKIRLEENCYDYEDQFQYMLSVKRNVLLDTTIHDDEINSIARIVQHIIADTLTIAVAIEVGEKIEWFLPTGRA